MKKRIISIFILLIIIASDVGTASSVKVYVTDDIFGITEGEIGCGGDEKNCINVTP
ncbi:MAG: hypothetical protein LBU14_03825 [Candidatus Peribacteria bacterium]|jgi:hypothetical protein|nr:hypothetical protein [Candidatus Peribacteria bacterium]